jgi:long-subunit acyl-CoA synthetase (AMP-forming)
VLDAAHGLLALGVDVGDRVCIHSEDRREWIVLDLATVKNIFRSNAVAAKVFGRHRPATNSR